MLKTHRTETPGEQERPIPGLPKLRELPLFPRGGTNHNYYSCSPQLEARSGVDRGSLGNHAFQRISYFSLLVRTLAL